jgi:hypothetical protein
MKKLNIAGVTLMVNVETPIKIGNNDAIEVTLVHQAFISRNSKGKIDIDLEFSDIVDKKFLGIEINGGFKEWKQFKETMTGLGINVDELIDDAEQELVRETNMKEQLKFEFMDKI